MKRSLCALLLAIPLWLGCAEAGPTGQFQFAVPEPSTRLSNGSFEYVRFGATGRVSIPKRREAMKAAQELGLVNEALSQIYAQAPKGEPIALVNVVVEVSRVAVTKSTLFTGTSTRHEDAELVIRADIIRFTSGPRPQPPSPTPAPAPASPAPPPVTP